MLVQTNGNANRSSMAFKFACNLLPKILPWHAYVQRVRGDLTNDDLKPGFHIVVSVVSVVSVVRKKFIGQI